MASPTAVNDFQYTGDIKMKDNKALTEKELDDISGGPHLTTWSSVTRRFVTYTEQGSPFKVEIHGPKTRPIPSGDSRKRPIWQ
jgi:hypothetical protein